MINKWGKWGRAMWQEKHQGHYYRSYLKTSQYVDGLSREGDKGDKQAETACWGQEFASHLKTIK